MEIRTIDDLIKYISFYKQNFEEIDCAACGYQAGDAIDDILDKAKELKINTAPPHGQG